MSRIVQNLVILIGFRFAVRSEQFGQAQKPIVIGFCMNCVYEHSDLDQDSGNRSLWFTEERSSLRNQAN